MRSLMAFLVAVFFLVCVAEAKTKFKLNCKFSGTDIAGACADVDGKFIPGSSDGGNYSCIKQNCDGKGGYFSANAARSTKI